MVLEDYLKSQWWTTRLNESILTFFFNLSGFWTLNLTTCWTQEVSLCTLNPSSIVNWKTTLVNKIQAVINFPPNYTWQKPFKIICRKHGCLVLNCTDEYYFTFVIILIFLKWCCHTLWLLVLSESVSVYWTVRPRWPNVITKVMASFSMVEYCRGNSLLSLWNNT